MVLKGKNSENTRRKILTKG